MGRSIFILIAAIAIASTAIALIQRPNRDTPISTDVPVATKVSPTSLTPTLVGYRVCSECHQENFRLHRESGHASTFASTKNSVIAKKFVGKTLDAGEPYGLLTYSMGDEGLSVSRAADPTKRSFLLEYSLGSGKNAVTFLSLAEDAAEDTIGIEHRVSWFADDDHFGLTPGQIGTSPTTSENFFGNSVHGKHMDACVSCHTTSGTIVDQKIVDLVPNVNCEKCHGAGSEHVRQARESKSPPPFSVGNADWNAESELQLCGECHRMPSDFSPKQLREYPPLMARFQPVGMLRSECYLQSHGELKCTTCHNPHQASDAKSMSEYVDDCLQCHAKTTTEHVTCPVSPTDGCIECHMPAIRFEQGLTFHDHYIRVHPEL